MKSRFFDELPEESLKWLTPRVQAGGGWFARPNKSAWDDAVLIGGTDNAIAQKFNKAATGAGWRIGESVAHAKFGEGVIVNIEGSGNNARAQINFGSAGMKVLDLSIAKLDRV